MREHFWVFAAVETVILSDKYGLLKSYSRLWVPSAFCVLSKAVVEKLFTTICPKELWLGCYTSTAFLRS